MSRLVHFAGALVASVVMTSIGAIAAPSAPPPASVAQRAPPPVVLHPPFDATFACSYHPTGQLNTLGDALGVDCFITSLVLAEGGVGWSAPHRGNGAANADWFGWEKPVLAPFDGIVVALFENPNVNTPGVMRPGRASSVTLARADGMHVVIAHVQSATVRIGDAVKAGQPIARVGNNGYSRAPHIHMGAYKEGVAYPIAFDPNPSLSFLVNGEVWKGDR